jgi:hypothetical protein
LGQNSDYVGQNNPNSPNYIGTAADNYKNASPTSSLTTWTPAMAAANPLTNFQLMNGGMTPQQAAAGAGGTFDKIMNGIIDTGTNVGLAAITGGAASSALGGGFTGAVGGGAASGLVNTAGGALANNTALTGKSLGTGTALGALGGALGYIAKPAATALSSSTGLSQPLASGIVKGAIGAGTGALSAKLSGGSASNAAILGGAGGFLSGAVSGATDSNALGKAASTLGSAAISPLLGGSSSSAPSSSAAAATGAATGAAASGIANIGNIGQGNTTGMALSNNGGGSALAPNASTDSSLASTITGALPGLLQAGVGTAGSLAASNAISNADQNAITTQQNNLGNINNIWSTQQGLGQGADTALGSALGTNGQAANYSNFENMPGYQFAVQQGTQAIQRQAAAMGSAYTPNTAAAVGQYVTGTASQDYNTYISQLMGAAGLGSTANQGLQTANQQTANNISTLQQNIGQAQATGYTGVANSAGSLFGTTGAGTGLINGLMNGNSSGVQPINYGGSNPNGTSGSGTSSDPYGANASAYNQANVGNTSIDPSTGQSWTSGVQPISTDVNTGDLQTVDTGDLSSIDSDGTDFLGDF